MIFFPISICLTWYIYQCNDRPFLRLIFVFFYHLTDQTGKLPSLLKSCFSLYSPRINRILARNNSQYPAFLTIQYHVAAPYRINGIFHSFAVPGQCLEPCFSSAGLRCFLICRRSGSLTVNQCPVFFQHRTSVLRNSFLHTVGNCCFDIIHRIFHQHICQSLFYSVFTTNGPIGKRFIRRIPF